MAEGKTNEVVSIPGQDGDSHFPAGGQWPSLRWDSPMNASFPRSDLWRGEDGFAGHNTRNEATNPEGLNLWPSGFILYARQQLGRGALPHPHCSQKENMNVIML